MKAQKKCLINENVTGALFNINGGHAYIVKDSKIYRMPLSSGSLEYLANIPKYSYVGEHTYHFSARYSIIGGEVFFYEVSPG